MKIIIYDTRLKLVVKTYLNMHVTFVPWHEVLSMYMFLFPFSVSIFSFCCFRDVHLPV